MTIYEKAKSLVTAREAAEHYGLTVNRYGLALCPFHDDHNPSMKLDDRFHCFGCGEDGDVIVSNAATPSGVAADCRQSYRQCIEMHGESAERGRESPFCVQSMLIQEYF